MKTLKKLATLALLCAPLCLMTSCDSNAENALENAGNAVENAVNDVNNIGG